MCIGFVILRLVLFSGHCVCVLVYVCLCICGVGVACVVLFCVGVV